MLTDLEKVSAGTTFRGDVCVVGAGVAGLLLADRLGRAGFDVLLLEAGGKTLETRSQSLFETEMVGEHLHGAEAGRYRVYGGSSTQWGAQLLPFAPEVFEPRPAVSGIGWPISGTDIARYYPDILKVMGANQLPFDESFLQEFGVETRVDGGIGSIRVRFSKFAPFSKRNMARTVGQTCLDSKRVKVFLHANAVSIDLGPEGDEVVGITARNYRGADHVFTARQYVISSGTIETSRLLLDSTGVRPAGVGNETDQVGRYFHDHLTSHAATLPAASLPVFNRLFAPYFVRGTTHVPKLEASYGWQRRAQQLGVMAHFFIHEATNSGFGMLRQALHDSQAGKFPIHDMKTLLALPQLAFGTLKMAYSVKVQGRRFPLASSTVTLHLDTEQRPRADSRVMLGESYDALGRRKVALDWKTSAEEGEALHSFAPVVDGYLKSLGMRDVGWRAEWQESAEQALRLGNDINHHMGGTRMADSAETSVVDRDLKVHGIANLHIASCSVFPTGGSSNPTFTLMALALRLADTLREKLRP